MGPGGVVRLLTGFRAPRPATGIKAHKTRPEPAFRALRRGAGNAAHVIRPSTRVEPRRLPTQPQFADPAAHDPAVRTIATAARAAPLICRSAL
jgi:hypothetical protein